MADIQTSERIGIFISFSYKDENLLQELVKQLRFLSRLNQVNIWHSRKIEPGERFSTAIHTNLNAAQLILLLISPDFIDSKYCYDIEAARALERSAAGEAKVIPIILRPTNWQKLPIGKLQALPTDGKPVITWPSRDEAFTDVALGVSKIVTALRAEKVSNKGLTALPEATKLPSLGIGETPGHDPSLDLASTYIRQGQKQFHAGNYEQALQAYETARHFDPSNSGIYRAIGECLTLLDRPDEAFMMYKQVAPLEAARYRGYGDMLRTLGDYETALEAYDLALGLSPLVAETHLRKADLLMHLGRLEEAQDAYEQADELMDD